MYEMHFYATKTKDGLIHVQNVVMGMMGQHHVHTLDGWRRWKKTVTSKYTVHFSAGKCDCGLMAGQVKSHTGNVTVNPLFV